MDKLNMETKNLAEEKYEALKKLFPNAITETIDENGEIVKAIDKDILMQEISTEVVEGKDERYQFTWPDKRKAILSANAPTSKTLRPCREESVNFDETENLYIEGDNLEVLKLLQETYLNKIKMIYIDPPYNTGNDFIYNDNFKESTEDYLEYSGQFDEDGNRLEKNLESNGRFHTDWLNMMYPRLKLAKNLLSDDGVIFISIDDNEQSNLKKMCDEIFGEVNMIAQLIRTTRKGGGSMSKHISKDHDYILVYAKNINKVGRFYLPYSESYLKRYSEKDEIGRYYWDTFQRNRQGSANNYTIKFPDNSIRKGAWIYNKSKFKDYLNKGEIRFKKINDDYSLQIKQRINESGTIFRTELRNFTNNLATAELVDLLGRDIFQYSKPKELIKILIQSCINRDSLILDFFSGSGKTLVLASNILYLYSGID